MTDIFGPANADNAVTTRPADTRTFGAQDSWLVDCTPGNTVDGTRITAALLNGILADMRVLARGNGAKADTSPVVPDANDGAMLLRAVQMLVQRARSRVAVAAGTANAIVTGVVPPLGELIAGQMLTLIVSSQNTGAVTVNVDGLGVRALQLSDAGAIPSGFLRVGDIVEMVYDGAAWRLFHRLASETVHGVTRHATSAEIAARTPNVSVTADKIGDGIVVTGAAGVFSRAVLFNKYVIMEGTSNFVGPGPHTLTLPVAYANDGYGFNAISSDGSGRTVSANTFTAGTVQLLIANADGTPPGAGSNTTIKWTSASASV
jgi:hypothetical protein